MKNPSAILRRAIHYMLLNVHTCIPGAVQSYNPATRLAEVRPLIHRLYVDGKIVVLPQCVNCPVSWPSTQAGSVTLKLQPGDTGMLHFAERSIDSWVLTGEAGPPAVARNHDLSDAIFVPGVGPGLEIYTGGVENYDIHVATADGAEIIIDGGSITATDATGAGLSISAGTVALGSQTIELLSLITQALTDIAAATTVTDGQALTCAAQLTVIAAQLATITGSL